MTPQQTKKERQAGFTLIELMIAVAITAFVLAATFATYTTQQKSQVLQDQIAEMQQNLRAAMLMMTRDIREAGCDPKMTSGAGFVTATAGQIRFTRDIVGHLVNPNQEDGDVADANEDIIFGFDPTVDTDPDPDGIPDIAVAGIPVSATAGDFTRNDVNDTNIFQPIAENIQRVEFSYLDEDGIIIAAPITSQSERNRIRAVQVSLLVRSDQQDSNFLNTATYTTAAGTVWGPFNDRFRRRLATTTIHCRNEGLMK